MPRYSYEGPVLSFGKCVCDHWYGETWAPTEKKARTNLAYQFKKQGGLIAATNVVIPGNLVVME